MESIVYISKGNSRRENVKFAAASALRECAPSLAKSRKVLIKPNLMHHVRALSCTHVDAARGLLDVLSATVDIPIVIGESSRYNTKAAFRNYGFEHLEREYKNVSLVDFNNNATGLSEDADNALEALLDSGIFCISLSPLKTDRHVGVSMCVDNWVAGCFVPPARVGSAGIYFPRWDDIYGLDEASRHEAIASRFIRRAPDLSIIDGHIGMEGEGPLHGTMKPVGIAIAGLDAVATDATACRLIGVDPYQVQYLKILSVRGIGTINKTDIKINNGEDIESYCVPFQMPQSWVY